MFNVGAGELLAILLIALLVLGPDKLPDAARKMGKVMADVRRMSTGFQTEMRKAVNYDELKRDVLAGGQGPALPPLESEVSASNRPGPAPGAPTGGAADNGAAPEAGSSPAA